MPISMFINNSLFVCMLFTCPLMLYHRHFVYESERSRETMISSPLLAISKAFYTNYLLIFFQLVWNLKIQKISTRFLLIMLSSILFTHRECLINTLISWGHKTAIFCCRLLKRTRVPPFFPSVWYKPLRHPCGAKIMLDSLFYAWSPD
jgi:hypothetical protein